MAGVTWGASPAPERGTFALFHPGGVTVQPYPVTVMRHGDAPLTAELRVPLPGGVTDGAPRGRPRRRGEQDKGVYPPTSPCM